MGITFTYVSTTRVTESKLHILKWNVSIKENCLHSKNKFLNKPSMGSFGNFLEWKLILILMLWSILARNIVCLNMWENIDIFLEELKSTPKVIFVMQYLNLKYNCNVIPHYRYNFSLWFYFSEENVNFSHISFLIYKSKNDNF